VDLKLKRVLRYTSAGAVDFNNERRFLAGTVEVPFSIPKEPSGISHANGTAPLALKSTQRSPSVTDAIPDLAIDLPYGTYLVEFNELVNMPLDSMGELMTRSSMFRSGAIVSCGLVDAGYNGMLGGMLQVKNPFGIRLWKNARVAQLVVRLMTEEVVGYSGVYQGAESM